MVTNGCVVSDSNITVDMTGVSKSFSISDGAFYVNLKLSNLSTISQTGGSFGGSSGTLTVAGDVTAASTFSWSGALTINNGNTLDMSTYGLTISGTTTNNGTLTGTSGTWTMNGDFTNGATGTVNATSGTWSARRNFTNSVRSITITVHCC